MTTQAPSRLHHALLFLLMLVALVITNQTGYAQTDQGRIVGTVRDQNGALVPGANVVVKNDRTGEKRTATANGEGVYIVPALRASQYTILVDAQNFATTTVTGVQLTVGQEQILDVNDISDRSQ